MSLQLATDCPKCYVDEVYSALFIVLNVATESVSNNGVVGSKVSVLSPRNMDVYFTFSLTIESIFRFLSDY